MRISQGSGRSAQDTESLAIGRRQTPTQPERDWVSSQYQPLISAKGLLNPDLMGIRNTLQKADSKPSGKITIALHGTLV